MDEVCFEMGMEKHQKDVGKKKGKGCLIGVRMGRHQNVPGQSQQQAYKVRKAFAACWA